MSQSFTKHITDFLTAPLRVQDLERQQDKLQAFLSAFPGEYCGLSADGQVLYSKGFAQILGLEMIASFADIQNALSPSDSAALEGYLDRLRETGTAFTLQVSALDERKHFKFSGGRGENMARTDHFTVLWVEDITAHIEASAQDQAKRDQQEAQLVQIKHALDAVPRPVWLRDGTQNITWVNKTYCDYLGKGAQDIIQDQLPITTGAAKRKKGAAEDKDGELAKAALETGSVQEEKIHGIYHGKRLLLRLTEVPLPDQAMTLGMAYNITREEELESEMNRFQTSSRELMEQLRSAIAIFDASQQLIFYNAAYAQLWGLEGSWLDRQPKLGDIMEKLREHRRLPEQANFRAFKASWIDMFTNLLKPHDEMLYLPDGSIVRMLIVPHSMGGLMMTFEDVTSRLALESSYNTLVAVQKETLDNLAEAVSVFGGDGRLKLCNPSYGQMWGLAPESLEGEPHINALLEAKRSHFDEASWARHKRDIAARALGHDLSAVRLKLDKAAKERLIDMSAVSLPDGGVLVTYSDVTSTVEIENALRDKAKALEAAEQLKLDFLANVSYQLRTPLSSIMGFTDILSHEYFGPLNARQKDYTSDIYAASQRLLDLINNILDLSTLEAGFLTLEREEVSIPDLFAHISDMVGDWARKEDISFQIEHADDLDPIHVDHKRIQQALINVIRNAIAHTPAQGEITLKASQNNKAMLISVTDTGSGIAQDDTKRIFAPFERAKDGVSQNGFARSGAGIGLSLVQKIIEAHNGSVDLESEEGKGTRVTFTLPFSSTKTSFKVPSADVRGEA